MRSDNYGLRSKVRAMGANSRSCRFAPPQSNAGMRTDFYGRLLVSSFSKTDSLQPSPLPQIVRVTSLYPQVDNTQTACLRRARGPLRSYSAPVPLRQVWATNSSHI